MDCEVFCLFIGRINYAVAIRGNVKLNTNIFKHVNYGNMQAEIQ